jgi:hypothetical protein
VTDRRAAALAVAAAGTLVLIGLVAVLSLSAPRLTGVNNVRFTGYPVILPPSATACSPNEDVPPGTRQLSFQAGPLAPRGPALDVTVLGRTARVAAGYRDGEVRVALPPGVSGHGAVCIANAGPGNVGIGGDVSPTIPPGAGILQDGKLVAGGLQLRYLAGSGSRFAAAGDVLRRWGYLTALGAATPYLAMLAFLLAFGSAIALVVRGRATALACAAVGFVAAAGWSATTPLFHVPDEPQHVAYVQRLAESGRPPVGRPLTQFSPEESRAFEALEFNSVAGNRSGGRPPWTAAQSRALERTLARDPGRRFPGGFTNTTNNPPLYYAAEALPYWVATAAGGDFLDRLLALRLGSALFVGAAAGFAFAFLRELLPRRPWAWPVGALALAVQPLAGFIGGGVNNDAALWTASAALLWLVARALRRGLDRRGAVGIGLAFGLGLIAKATMIFFAPALLVLVAVLLARAPAERAGRVGVLRRTALGAAVAAAPVLVYLVLNQTVWDRSLWTGGGTAAATAAGKPVALRQFVSYLWQFYLPRLPFMSDEQAGWPLYNVWFTGFIGKFGWLDTPFPAAVYTVAAVVFAGVVALAGVALWRLRSVLGRVRGEIVVWAAVLAGFVVVVGWAGYRGRLDSGFVFEQARYLLPLGGLYAALVALAAIGAGRTVRSGRAAGAALVTLACGHALFAVLLVVGRFYA